MPTRRERLRTAEINPDNIRWAYVIPPSTSGPQPVLRRMPRFIREHHVLSDEVLEEKAVECKEKAPTDSKDPGEENLSAPQIPRTELTRSQILQLLARIRELRSRINLEHQPDNNLRPNVGVSAATSTGLEQMHVSTEEYDWLAYMELLGPDEDEVSFTESSENTTDAMSSA
ncbi:hypothetical protein BGX38DRAFT_173822 [Terfezia claveryi]|nr:hypothetical protein BGX38DRAFT_173822 [Terfezia claveryi]